jgi:hypothetical protein
MSLTYSERLKREIRARRAKPSQQFGQANDSLTSNGATGCTDTVLQWMIWRTKGRWYTHDQVRQAAGIYQVLSRGLRPSEVQRVIDHFGLPYKIVHGWPALSIARASKLGLVGVGQFYPWWPEWRGFRYGNVHADGKPNGYATPTGKAGRTQLAGFTGRHMGMLLGYATDPTGPDLYYGWEPNHGSAVRPERPPYDRMTFHQFQQVVESYGTTYAVVPKGAKE